MQMGSSIISFIFTFNTLLVLTTSFPRWNWPPFPQPSPGGYPRWNWPPFPQPSPGGYPRWNWPPFPQPPPGGWNWPPFPQPPPGGWNWPPFPQPPPGGWNWPPFPQPPPGGWNWPPFPQPPPGGWNWPPFPQPSPGGWNWPPFPQPPPGGWSWPPFPQPPPGGWNWPPFPQSPPGGWNWPPFPQSPPGGPFPASPPLSPTGPVTARSFYECIESSTIPHKQVTFSDHFFSVAVDKAKFTEVLNSTAQNFRLLEDSVPKPIIIFRPTDESQVSPAVWCAQRYNLNIRVRSGGHDYEGLSFISLIQNQQFMILDLFNLRGVNIDTERLTAWVQAGGTNGELYYKISQANRRLAFPAGLCTTLGIGGHLTGGAYGSMLRKFGLAADNVLDVRMVDALGIVRSRENGTMDDDLFWALRGGGGGNFGVILAWKIKLVTVPWNVTMFTSVIPREAKGAEILQKWQTVAPEMDPNLFIRVIMQTIPNTRTVLSIYQALYIGSANELVSLMREKLPELGVLSVDNCTEMSWIQSVLNIGGYPAGTKPDYMLKAIPAFPLQNMKAKSDFLRNVMPINAIEGLWDIFVELGPSSMMIWNLYGGRMDEIPESATPFPHRARVICKIQYVASWNDPSAAKQLEMEDKMRVMYAYMAAYVPNNPREAYVNYRDLDIGKREGTGSNCSYPAIWGPKYFKGNFPRLVEVKSKVDPGNFFNNEQSIPTRWIQNRCTDVI